MTSQKNCNEATDENGSQNKLVYKVLKSEVSNGITIDNNIILYKDDTKIKEFETTIDNYIDKGFFVVPCKDKIPQMPSWNNAEDQTKDEVLDFIKSGRANQIGIRTDKYFVIDVDVKHNKNGFESLKQFV